jgi:hypothetical protein
LLNFPLCIMQRRKYTFTINSCQQFKEIIHLSTISSISLV